MASAGGGSMPSAPQTVAFGAALIQIIVADVSMSLDNVLAVAGAAKGEIWVLVVGLTIAVVFMAVASAYIAKLLSRYHWITWIGLAGRALRRVRDDLERHPPGRAASLPPMRYASAARCKR